ncbi:hypothetical protein PIB30_104332 [Stylosanthes scabra]|uniref:Uncharacterized protein n=1 Tax=Stylosanthes scabra TaxID=79078 RepID=A0ABU6UX56_9FABA|nr:hypothetical protein [Stylosanthes scabra]
MMNEQIMVLQNKLLEALDWKFMHQTDLNTKSVTEDVNGDNNLVSDQDPKSRWQSSLREENEFLRIQAIQNQAEMDTIRKKLEVCLQEKEKLERDLHDLTTKFEQEKYQATTEGREQMDLPSATDMPVININGQQELKAMVDAIASASQREAEAHETAIVLSKENDELRLKLKTLIEDNSKLIELYEQAAAGGRTVDEVGSIVDNGRHLEPVKEEENELKSVVENLQHQLNELNEENEKLMTLYERAMQEKDDLKRALACSEQENLETRGETDCHEKVVEVDGGKILSIEETDEADVHVNSAMDIEVSNCTASKFSDELNCAREKLGIVDEQISDAVRNLSSLGCVEKATVEVDTLSSEIELIEHDIQVKRESFESLKVMLSDAHERRTLADKKFSALKYSLSNFSSSFAYFEQREARARAGVNDLACNINRKKEALIALQASKEGLVNAQKKNQESEAELIANIATIKSKLEEENRKREGDKVLFAIDNTQHTDPAPKTWHFSGKATELLKLEEEKTKLQSEMNLSLERLAAIRKELGNLNKKLASTESEIESVQLEIQHILRTSEEKELALQRVMKEKEMLLEFRDNGFSEVGRIIVELHQCVFECDLKEAEIKVLDEELATNFTRVQELQTARIIAANSKNNILSSLSPSSMLVRIEERMQNLKAFILEIKLLLDGISHAT